MLRARISLYLQRSPVRESGQQSSCLLSPPCSSPLEGLLGSTSPHLLGLPPRMLVGKGASQEDSSGEPHLPTHPSAPGFLPTPNRCSPRDSLIHQPIWDLGPVRGEVPKIVEEWGDLLLDIFLQKDRRREQVGRTASPRMWAGGGHLPWTLPLAALSEGTLCRQHLTSLGREKEDLGKLEDTVPPAANQGPAKVAPTTPRSWVCGKDSPSWDRRLRCGQTWSSSSPGC